MSCCRVARLSSPSRIALKVVLDKALSIAFDSAMNKALSIASDCALTIALNIARAVVHCFGRCVVERCRNTDFDMSVPQTSGIPLMEYKKGCPPGWGPGDNMNGEEDVIHDAWQVPEAQQPLRHKWAGVTIFGMKQKEKDHDISEIYVGRVGQLCVMPFLNTSPKRSASTWRNSTGPFPESSIPS